MAPDGLEKTTKCWFSLNNLSFYDHVSLKFIWFVTVNKIQVELRKEAVCQFGQDLWPLLDV